MYVFGSWVSEKGEGVRTRKGCWDKKLWRVECFFGTCCLLGWVHMEFKNFFLSWKCCTCFWLRLVGIGLMVFRGRGVCALCFEVCHVCLSVCFDCVGWKGYRHLPPPSLVSRPLSPHPNLSRPYLPATSSPIRTCRCPPQLSLPSSRMWSPPSVCPYPEFDGIKRRRSVWVRDLAEYNGQKVKYNDFVDVIMGTGPGVVGKKCDPLKARFKGVVETVRGPEFLCRPLVGSSRGRCAQYPRHSVFKLSAFGACVLGSSETCYFSKLKPVMQERGPLILSTCAMLLLHPNEKDHFFAVAVPLFMCFSSLYRLKGYAQGEWRGSLILGEAKERNEAR
jgi:hypothetical protein